MCEQMERAHLCVCVLRAYTNINFPCYCFKKRISYVRIDETLRLL